MAMMRVGKDVGNWCSPGPPVDGVGWCDPFGRKTSEGFITHVLLLLGIYTQIYR